ncbi:DUF3576 domain-containing protein [Azospirillum halopraeferens]|uniref:DUF3576 domain-containing protein n=1 Tax=Azospirillum halopraeferens TaxID=34010 RepID=UPI000423775B|nr:DUF3576 domain-containing protein [Azospirillum halopraeferens]
MRRTRTALFAPVILATIAVGACSSLPEGQVESHSEQVRRDMYRFGSVLGTDGGINLLGNNRQRQQGDGTGIGVNSFLWRASLDTLAFMPIVSADPFGGVILTDWYSPPETPNERFKVNLYILDRQLRADGVRVSVFRQQRTGADWRDVAVGPETGKSLEDAVLTRARQIRVTQASQ